MQPTLIVALASLAAAAPATEPRATWTQWFSKVRAQPEAFKPNNLLFDFRLSFTDGTTYLCSTSHDIDTGVSARTPCTWYTGEAREGIHATVTFPDGQASIQNFSPWVYFADGHQATANISTADPSYVCAHSGTEGVAAQCIGSSTYTATYTKP